MFNAYARPVTVPVLIKNADNTASHGLVTITSPTTGVLRTGHHRERGFVAQASEIKELEFEYGSRVRLELEDGYCIVKTHQPRGNRG